jgi:hypothetical protein
MWNFQARHEILVRSKVPTSSAHANLVIGNGRFGCVHDHQQNHDPASTMEQLVAMEILVLCSPSWFVGRLVYSAND